MTTYNSTLSVQTFYKNTRLRFWSWKQWIYFLKQ